MKSSYFDLLSRATGQGIIAGEVAEVLRQLYQNYLDATASNGVSREMADELMTQFLEQFLALLQNPPQFGLFHRRVVAPFDYTTFALAFTRALVKREQSHLLGEGSLRQMMGQLGARHNVILFANHQVELDTQLLQLMLTPYCADLAKEMVFVAGHRVTSDPMAVPFSLGTNLICVYSKRHIDAVPELRLQRTEHNVQSMQRLLELLQEGGFWLYVAPSGGRDRPNAQGVVEVAPFDAKSIEMFRMMAERAGVPTHYYPLALDTYELLPPPDQVVKVLGEMRVMRTTGVGVAFGEELSMEPEADWKGLDRAEIRERRAAHFEQCVCGLYQQLIALH